VRRECAIALHGCRADRAAPLWAELAALHNGQDRWNLEALGIGADGQWDHFLEAYLATVGDKWNTPGGRDVLWRSRATVTADYLAKIIADPNTVTGEVPRYFRAFDFQSESAKAQALARLGFEPVSGDPVRQTLVATEALARLPAFDLVQHPERAAALNRVLDQTRETTQFVALVGRFNIRDRYPELLKLAVSAPDQPPGFEAARTLLARDRKLVEATLAGDDTPSAVGLAKALGNSADGGATALLIAQATNVDRPRELRQEAVRGLGKSKNGATKLVELARSKQLPEDVKPIAAFAIHAGAFEDLKKSAADIFPLPPARNDKPLPPLAQLLKSRGETERGKKIFADVGTCAKCHVVNNEGKEVGPNLSEIGSKLSREAMFESILFPSAGISHNYETYAVALNDGTSLVGLITTQTPDSISLKGADAIVRTIKRSDIDEMSKQPLSLMPADLQRVMTADELVDVVEYLQTLKKK
jgi:putative heme-binding domain-containing protein